MASPTPAQIAAAAAWLNQHAAAVAQVQASSAAAARALWAEFDAWYSAAAVTAVAEQAAKLSTANQQVIVGAAQAYIANVVAALSGSKVTIPRTPVLPPVRGESTPLTLAHSRPAETYKKAYATGAIVDRAVDLAVERAANLQVTDLTLANRAASQAVMGQLGITGYRRVVRPELSKTGTCGLCIAASDRIYKTDEIMPLHDRCNCETMPIVNGVDPGASLNNLDLGALYDAAGSNKAADLKATRYQVNTHGEYGPVLGRDGQSFRGPGQVRLEDDPARAQRMLAKVIPVLHRLEADHGPADALEYQRELAARLTAIAA